MLKKSKLYIVLYLFCFIYFPPLFSFNLIHVLTVYSFFALLLKYKKKHYSESSKVLKKYYITPFIVIFIYLFFVIVFNNANIFNIYTIIILGFELPICIIYLLSYFIKRDYSVLEIINTLFIVTFLQGAVSIIAFLSPTIKDILINLYINNQTNSYVSTNVLLYMADTRLNGLSSNLTFTTPIIQAMSAIIAIYFSLHINYKYFFISPILIISAIINSRSSLVVLGVGFILLLMSLTNKKKVLARLITLSILGVVTIVLAVTSASRSSFITFEWISSGYNEIIRFIQGEKIGYFEILFSNFFQWPNGIYLIFGTGNTIFGGRDIFSDVGYVNDVWLGGILYTVLAYGTFGFFYYNAYRKNNKLVKFVEVLFVSIFVLMNIKGSIISNNDFVNITILLTSIFILNKRGVIKFR